MTGLDVSDFPALPTRPRAWRHPIASLLAGAASLRSRAATNLRHGVWFVRRLLLSWTGRRRFANLRALLAALVAIPLFVLFASSLLSPLQVWPVWFTPFDASCQDHGFACNAMTELFAFAFALPAGFLLFLSLRLSRVKGRYIAAIRMQPDSLFPSWTSKREIVGRDALCDLIDGDFTLHGVIPGKRSRKRRPRIIVGDIGSGKTGMLVRLAQVLAERGAVPVPVRLRTAGEDLDFVE